MVGTDGDTRLLMASLQVDDPIRSPFHRQERGCHAEEVLWKTQSDWGKYDMVLVRTPWDYIFAGRLAPSLQAR